MDGIRKNEEKKMYKRRFLRKNKRGFVDVIKIRELGLLPCFEEVEKKKRNKKYINQNINKVKKNK